jgi:hypothetical protein
MYLILISALIFAIWFFYSFQGNPQYQFNLVIILSLFYFIWGFVYHRIKGDLHPKIMIEYLLIAVLTIIISKGAIYR